MTYVCQDLLKIEIKIGNSDNHKTRSEIISTVEDYFISRNFNLQGTIHQTDINNEYLKHNDKC